MPTWPGHLQWCDLGSVTEPLWACAAPYRRLSSWVDRWNERTRAERPVPCRAQTNGSRTGENARERFQQDGVLGFPKSGVGGPRGRAVTHWTPKGCSRIARLSHKPSSANLLAQ